MSQETIPLDYLNEDVNFFTLKIYFKMYVAIVTCVIHIHIYVFWLYIQVLEIDRHFSMNYHQEFFSEIDLISFFKVIINMSSWDYPRKNSDQEA